MRLSFQPCKISVHKRFKHKGDVKQMQSGETDDKRQRAHDHHKLSAGVVCVKCLKVLLKYVPNCITVWSRHLAVTSKRLWTLRPSKLASKLGSQSCLCKIEEGRGEVRASHLIIKYKGNTFSHSLAPTCVCQEKVKQLPFTWDSNTRGDPRDRRLCSAVEKENVDFPVSEPSPEMQRSDSQRPC